MDAHIPLLGGRLLEQLEPRARHGERLFLPPEGAERLAQVHVVIAQPSPVLRRPGVALEASALSGDGLVEHAHGLLVTAELGQRNGRIVE